LAVVEIENQEDARAFPDVNPNEWYYASVLAATSSHELRRAADGSVVWMKFLP